MKPRSNAFDAINHALPAVDQTPISASLAIPHRNSSQEPAFIAMVHVLIAMEQERPAARNVVITLISSLPQEDIHANVVPTSIPKATTH
jgi:hypothetical protein